MRKNSKIYVAGHKGLVGSSILQLLQKKGYTNIIVKEHSELDLRDSYLVSDFFRKNKPEYVVLAAAKVGGISANNRYRAEFIYDNLMIQTNIIHYSYLNGVKKMLFLGSTCVYPKESSLPIKEEELLTSCLEYTNEPYSIAKIAGMKMCESYNLQYGTNFISAMPTNLYGINDNFDLEDSHVIPALIRKFYLAKALEDNNWISIRRDLNQHNIGRTTGDASKKEILDVLKKYGVIYSNNKTSVEIWGTGKPKREFLFSKDMAEACVFLLEEKDFDDMYNKDISDIRNSHVNIGTGTDISIEDLSKLIKKELDFEGSIFFNKNKPDGTMRKVTDTSKLKHLGWKSKVNIFDGIRLVCNWYASYQDDIK